MTAPRPRGSHPPPGARLFGSSGAFEFQLGGAVSQLDVAYETWGTLTPERDNAVLLCTGLSASSHAASHPGDPSPGWWEGMIGPGLAIDTQRWFVVCCNVPGGCFGSTGPASIDPETGRPYALSFPLVTVWDFVRAQALVLRHLGIEQLFAVLGSSLGGMQALAYGAQFPADVRRVIAISSPGRSYPLSIALRHVQRQAVMRDPEWHQGEYYSGAGPVSGLHVARQIGTITYRSGPEWDLRFGRARTREFPFDLDEDFQVESYLMYQGDRFVARYDANSYLYLSKAMDLFDLGEGAPSYEEGVARIQAETLVVGVTTDLLFPIHQQREVADLLGAAGRSCQFLELDLVYGHDSFLIDLERFGALIREFLER